MFVKCTKAEDIHSTWADFLTFAYRVCDAPRAQNSDGLPVSREGEFRDQSQSKVSGVP